MQGWMEKIIIILPWKCLALQEFRFDFKKAPAPLLVHVLRQHSLSQNFCFSRQIYTSIAYYNTAYYIVHEPLLLDSPVQIELWKSSKLIFFENSFSKDKSVGLWEIPCTKKGPKFAPVVELAMDIESSRWQLISEAKIYIYHSRKIAKAKPGYDIRP